MNFLGEWYRRLQYLFNRKRLEEDLRREMEGHRELMGRPARFGNTLRLREQSQDVWGWRWLDDLWKDLRFGARQFRQSLVFTCLAVLTLAIGIGAATFMASVLKFALFAEPPVRHLEELRQFSQAGGARSLSPDRADVSYPVYRHVRDNMKTLSDVVCLGAVMPVNFGIRGSAERGTARVVSGNYFQGIGVPIALGREIAPDDDAAGSSTPVAVLSYGFWQRALGGDANALGQVISVNGASFVVVGVTSQTFYFASPKNPDVFLPVAQYPQVRRQADALRSGQPVCQIIGRIRPETSDVQALREGMGLVRQASMQEAPRRAQIGDDRGYAAGNMQIRRVGRLVDDLGPDNIDWLSVTGAVFVVGSVVLIACSNIAGMLLARGSARRSEIATRLALGAGRPRIVRQLLTESVLLSGSGGLVGILLGVAGLRLVSDPTGLAGNLGVDSYIMLVIAGVSVATGIVLGLAPALSATRMDLTSVMKHASSASPGRLRSRLVKPLIAVQVALSFLLLITAGLHIRSFLNLTSQRAQVADLIVFQADPRASGYTRTQIASYYENALKSLATIPGVIAPSVSHSDYGVDLCVRDSQFSNGAKFSSAVQYVTPNYFEVERMRLSAGRKIEWSDHEGAAKVAIVTESFAKQKYPGRSALGMTLGLAVLGSDGKPQCNVDEVEVVGVVADEGDRTGPVHDAGVYLPFLQQQDMPAATFALRVNTEPAAFAVAIRRTMLDLDSNTPIFGLDEGIASGKRNREGLRSLTAALLLFGAIALLQASLGIYGTLSYSVSRRTGEIGVRMALGARRPRVVFMIVREMLVPVVAGVVCGLLGSPVLARVFSQNMFGSIGPYDQWTIVLAAAALVVSAIGAASTPAWRASRLDPMRALRYE